MKIKKAIFSVAALAALSMSCSSLDVISTRDGDGGRVDPPSGEGYLSLGIALPATDGSGTRAGVEYGYPDEIMVDRVRVVFYLSDKVAEVWDLDASNIDVGPEAAPGALLSFYGEDVDTVLGYSAADLFFSTPRLMKIAPYKVVVIANPTDRIAGLTAAGKPLSALEEAAAATVDELTGGVSRNRFVMTNRTGPVSVSAANFADTPAGAIERSFQVSIERAVARITVTYDPDAVNEMVFRNYDWAYVMQTGKWQYMTLDLVSLAWRVDAVNRQSYWLRRPTGDDYALDPNFSGYADLNRTRLDKEFIYLDPSTAWEYGWYYSPEGEHMSELSPPRVYVTENTMDTSDQFSNLTTSVILKAVFGYRLPFVPVVNPPVRFSDLGESAGLHFLVFTFGGKTIAIPHEAVSQYVMNALYDPDYKPYTDQFSGRNYNLGYYDIWNQLLSGYSDWTYRVCEALDVAVERGVLTSSNPDSQEPFTLDIPHTASSLSFFKHGVGYYTVPIRHNESQTSGPDAFGVVRNNIYNINIKRLGMPSPTWPGSDPQPLNSISRLDNVDIEGVITVTPWETIEKDVTFGPTSPPIVP
jgi:hypothetical protein